MSENPNVDERTPEPPVSLTDAGASLLDEARSNDNGRAALTLTPAPGGPLKQTLLALTAGHELSEHPTPGPASLHVLEGSATLIVGEDDTAASAGTWLVIPREPHRLRAEQDTLALLTVVTKA